MQYFFSNSAKLVGAGKASDLPAKLAKAGVKDTVRMLTYPLAENKIMVRFENLADTTPAKVDLASIAVDLWDSVNGDLAAQVAMKEVTLTGNMGIQEMRDRKIQWNYEGKTAPKSDDVFNNKDFELKGLGIRVFEIYYTLEEPKPQFTQ